MAEAVSSHEFLRQQGATFVVFHPCGEQLVLGLGCNEQPAVVPHCVAYRKKAALDQTARSVLPAPWPQQQAYEALLQVQRLLHLPAPPKPSSLQQQQQQQEQDGAKADPFAAAKAGLVSQKEVAEGSDGFMWLDDQQQEKLEQQRQQQLHAARQQQQQQQLPQPQQHSKHRLACFAGGQVPALWPPDAYEAHWLMTSDNHIQGLDTTPQHILLDRFEAAWGFSLAQLGLTRSRCRHLSAVLAVPIDMTAAEVRLLADLLLDRLGFAALVVHLEPVAATFGNGTTSACVVNVGSSCCTVCCVDDAVVLPPLKSRFTLPVGLVDLAGSLTGWMSCYGHWPVQLQQHGIGFSAGMAAPDAGAADEQPPNGQDTAAGAGAGASSRAGQELGGLLSPASIYNMLLLEDLVLQQCYFPKENYQPGLLGQPMLEDQQPAVVPVRIPGQPTTNYNVSLGSWAAAASMTLFFPDLAPPGFSAAVHEVNPSQADIDAPAQATVVKQEPQQNDDNTIPAAPPPSAAAVASASDSASGLSRDCLFQRYHSHVLDLPAAEALHLQSQLKVRLEAGETGPPPDGMYLLPLELPEKPVGATAATTAAAGGGAPGASTGAATPTPGSAVQPAQSGGGSSMGRPPDAAELKSAIAAAAAAGVGGGGGATAAARGASQGPAAGRSQGPDKSSRPSMGLDEAVYRSIMATSAGRPDLMARLSAGLLLIGPGGGLRGLGPMLERRVGQRLSKSGNAQVVSSLEPRAEPAHVAWKGAALLAALDAGRENWLPRHQWVDGGMVLPAPPAPKGPPNAGAAAAAVAAAAKKGPGAAGAAASGGAAGSGGASGSTSTSTAAAGRHTKLFYYCRAEQGML